MTNYIIKPLGEMYMEEVTADDIRLALVPLSKKSEGLDVYKRQRFALPLIPLSLMKAVL